MCGIAGVVSTSGPVHMADLESMRDTFSYRGPDDAGAWLSPDSRVALGHRRLSILDTSLDGHQPMICQESGCVIVFNGEVFNFIEIRAELEKQGYQFRSHSDTEVILKAYLCYGKDCVKHFNGMFALAIWDPRSRNIFFLRDRLGIKPLYYCLDGGKLTFASEVKAIKVLLEHKNDLNTSLIDHYMSFGYIPGHNTLIEGVKRLPPGYQAIFSLNTGMFEMQQYWDLPDKAEPDRGLEYYLDAGRELIGDAIDIRLRSDVPLGIFLSGGIDSSAVVGMLAQRTTEQLKTYSVAYDFGKNYNETEYARLISQRFNTDHHELIVRPEQFRDFIPRYVHLMDEPVTEAAALSLYFLSEMTTKDVTVVLSGEGSDEVFAGYDLYQYMSVIEKYRSLVGGFGARLIGQLARVPGINQTKIAKYLNMGKLPLRERYKGISTYDERIKHLLYRSQFKTFLADSVHEEVQAYLDALFANQARSNLSKMLYFDTKTWLVDDLLIKADRMSMAASLELRVPFLDYRVVEFGARLPDHYKIRNGQGKYLLKKMVEGLLPEQIVYRKKMGFPTPLKMMFQGVMRDYSYDMLTSNNSKLLDYFDVEGVRYLLDKHISNRSDYHREIWQLVVLEEWLQQNA